LTVSGRGGGEVFFLSDGGFVEGCSTFGEKFTRPATGPAPDCKLPVIPTK